MANCELCGKEAMLCTALIEEIQLKVCEKCGMYGKVLEKPKLQVKQTQNIKQKKHEIIENIVENYNIKIKNSREKQKLTQEEFAQKLNEKTSFIQKLETKQILPSLEKARKLEKQLGILLVEEVTEKAIEQPKQTGPLTIGDLIKIKTKK